MKPLEKLSNFVVNKRFVVLGVMIGLGIICALLIFKVNINTDMSKYLPNDSSMKVGLNMLEDEFPGTKMTQTIRVMFEDLDADRTNDVKSKLENIKYVDSVTYDSQSTDYNKGKYTLFIINTLYDYESKEELAIKASLDQEFASCDIVYNNDSASSSEIPVWILITAITLLMVILFVMCGSWTEPFLFLFTIGIAIAINMGTNVFFNSVSNTTFSISAILQLVLSMDYSIILMNRYRQECVKTTDHLQAMKEALRNAFSSIAGSAVTTIVGLLMLLFMSYKIGMDLGSVLAKGVFISMICVFTILPGLILVCDGFIAKTAKKELRIHTDKLAGFSFRFRTFLAAGFLVLFAGTFILKGFTGIIFTMEMNDPIKEIFPPNNRVILMYENKDDKAIARLAKELQKDPNVKTAVSYPTTVGKPYTSSEMVDVLGQLDNQTSRSATQISESTLNLIYYNYFTDGKTESMTAGQFLNFVINNVATNKDFAPYLGKDIKANLSVMKKFSSAKTLTTPMNGRELASFFGMKKIQCEQILLYYQIKKGKTDPGKMTIPAFVNFLTGEIASNKTYASMAGGSDLNRIKQLAAYTDTKLMTSPMPAASVAQILGMSAGQMQQIFDNYNLSTGGSSPYLSTQTVVNFIVSNSAAFGPMLGQQALGQLQLLQGIINGSVSGTGYTSSQMADLLGASKDKINSVYLLHRSLHGSTSGWKLSPKGFVDFVLSDILTDKSLSASLNSAGLDSGSAEALSSAKAIIDAVVSGKAYTAVQMAALMGRLNVGTTGYNTTIGKSTIDKSTMELLYLYYASVKHSNPKWKISIYTLIHYLSDDLASDSKFSSVLTTEYRTQLKEVKEELDDSISLMRSPNHSLLILDTTLPGESAKTTKFLKNLTLQCDENLDGDYHIIGQTAMNYELKQGFNKELLLITLLTALSIFVVVAVTFRSFIIPAFLVLIVQCGVYMTMTASWAMGYEIYYMALLIVQSILMGATIDYGILFTNCYRENRLSMGRRDALKYAYRGAIRTILTSGSIMVFITGILGVFSVDPTIGQICRTISIGAFSAILLILFVLPGMLAAFDRFVHTKKVSKA